MNNTLLVPINCQKSGNFTHSKLNINALGFPSNSIKSGHFTLSWIYETCNRPSSSNFVRLWNIKSVQIQCCWDPKGASWSLPSHLVQTQMQSLSSIYYRYLPPKYASKIWFVIFAFEKKKNPLRQSQSSNSLKWLPLLLCSWSLPARCRSLGSF
jgi:hypothetical protein